MAAIPAEFISRVVSEPAPGTGGNKFFAALPAEFAGFLIFGSTPGTFDRR